MQVVRYLHGTWKYRIFHRISDADLQWWADADFMGGTRGTRNTAGIIFTMYGGAIAW